MQASEITPPLENLPIQELSLDTLDFIYQLIEVPDMRTLQKLQYLANILQVGCQVEIDDGGAFLVNLFNSEPISNKVERVKIKIRISLIINLIEVYKKFAYETF